MKFNKQMNPYRIAVLDLYQGEANQGMRGIQSIIESWSAQKRITTQVDYFDVRVKKQIPDLSYHAYISSGGPGSPIESRYEDWDIAWCQWLDQLNRWNQQADPNEIKPVFFICYSFQLACRFFSVGIICKRRSTSFGVFPITLTEDGIKEVLFKGLKNPFYAVDHRDYQLIQPNLERIETLGGQVLCIEKERPHVPHERAVMALRFNTHMIGTQFHPEADPTGMIYYLNQEDTRNTVIKNHGEEKLKSMLADLQDADKIQWTKSRVLPNFLDHTFSATISCKD